MLEMMCTCRVSIPMCLALCSVFQFFVAGHPFVPRLILRHATGSSFRIVGSHDAWTMTLRSFAYCPRQKDYTINSRETEI